MSYLIDSHEPSRAQLRAIFVAGHTIETRVKEAGAQFSASEFRWIKAEFRWPSFDHITLAYKDKVFSIIATLEEDIRVASRGRDALRCADACKDFDLVPCLFPVSSTKFEPAGSGWNLYDIRDMQPINPLRLASDRPAIMSEWEVHSLSIQCLVDHLTAGEAAHIDSCCDVLGIDPQIWFVDRDGQLNWVVVRCFPSPVGTNDIDWLSLVAVSPQLAAYRGFGAAVSVASASAVLYDLEGNLVPLSRRYDGSAPRYRGDKMRVFFNGLQRIEL